MTTAASPPLPAPPTPAPTSLARFTVAVSTREAKAGLRVDEVWDGDAPAIVVTAVAGGGDLAAAGVRPGLRLLSLPHPTRRGERWELAAGAPVARVRDLLRVSRGVELDAEFSVAPIPDDAVAAWLAEKEAAATAVASQEEYSSDSDSSPSSSALAASVAAGEPGGADAPAAEREARALARRLKRRAERNEAEAGRDDTGVVVGAALALLGPAGIILAVAAATGYLSDMQMRLM